MLSTPVLLHLLVILSIAQEYLLSLSYVPCMRWAWVERTAWLEGRGLVPELQRSQVGQGTGTMQIT